MRARTAAFMDLSSWLCPESAATNPGQKWVFLQGRINQEEIPQLPAGAGGGSRNPAILWSTGWSQGPGRKSWAQLGTAHGICSEKCERRQRRKFPRIHMEAALVLAHQDSFYSARTKGLIICSRGRNLDGDQVVGIIPCMRDNQGFAWLLWDKQPSPAPRKIQEAKEGAALWEWDRGHWNHIGCVPVSAGHPTARSYGPSRITMEVSAGRVKSLCSRYGDGHLLLTAKIWDRGICPIPSHDTHPLHCSNKPRNCCFIKTFAWLRCLLLHWFVVPKEQNILELLK
ncbi:uncharacterized protein LOC120324225 [Pipra filicauda]|uniref:Uncharacterized protein LOC120324225 n=1 Tax=Pipra filicauda TaxID=649802 RepID=A0A7R5KN90_9PASS|nr:uncharacterized protein LOC120324225 [Pipra filicauda]